MTPTAVKEVLLGLLPLYVMNEAEALAGIYRLMCSQQWKLKSTNFSHGTQYQNMQHERNVYMGTDRMTQRYAYH
jgi:hypothetical protein